MALDGVGRTQTSTIFSAGGGIQLGLRGGFAHAAKADCIALAVFTANATHPVMCTRQTMLSTALVSTRDELAPRSARRWRKLVLPTARRLGRDVVGATHYFSPR